MITMTETQLVISIEDSEPKERRDWLMQAIAAAIRWHAHAVRKEEDAENLVVLAELMAELVYVEKQEH